MQMRHPTPPLHPSLRENQSNSFSYGQQGALRPNPLQYPTPALNSTHGPITSGVPGRTAVMIPAATDASPSFTWPARSPLYSPAQESPDPSGPFRADHSASQFQPTGGVPMGIQTGGPAVLPALNLMTGYVSEAAVGGTAVSRNVVTTGISTVTGIPPIDPAALSTNFISPGDPMIPPEGSRLSSQHLHVLQGGMHLPPSSATTAAMPHYSSHAAETNPLADVAYVSAGHVEHLDDLVLDGSRIWHGTLDPEAAAAALAPVQRLPSSQVRLNGPEATLIYVLIVSGTCRYECQVQFLHLPVRLMLQYFYCSTSPLIYPPCLDAF